MKSIILKRGQLMWLASYYADGQPDPEVTDLFGLNELPTPFRVFHDAGEVALWVAKRNPGTSVEVE